MKLLLTGANGRMGAALRPLLLERAGVELVLSARSPMEDVAPRETVMLGDLADYDHVAKMLEGVDGIVHLGGCAKENTFDVILDANIRGTYNIFEAARKAGGMRVMFASSHHVTGFHPRSSKLGGDAEMRPDTLYGLSKCYGELLAKLYWYKFGVQSVSVRIGSCNEQPKDRRMLATWMSHNDMARLIFATFDAPETGAAMVYGVSDNPDSWWSNDHADFLGWKPEDSAEPWRAEILEQPKPDPTRLGEQVQGGVFAEWGHFEDQ
ncbi:NAD-dependent epimerase/dehydratase family protein (plasmid) [Falsihalocynthiibacter sp. SS001]|uniref:NAD-dependent epimerase/dehydratase family protein n=1 Tax=Falsihalocynthiibacter sp. SS001 TaxID=3349698 RepID=UPI0036D2AF65